ncbi:MAG: FAD-binding oxidoreductase [Cohaesibacter sp.]|nr:FAD-binding oxidoreductase [Cohaesibacter sp.]
MTEQMIANEPGFLSKSLWTATAKSFDPFPQLDGDHDCEIAIVGGGFAGLSAALHLAERGHDVYVLEAETPGWGASGRNGGQLVPGLKEDPDEIRRQFGSEMGERMVRMSGGAADFVFDLIKRNQIDCNASQLGWIQPIHSEAARMTVSKRCRQWQKSGAPLEMLDRDETAHLLGTDTYLGGMIDRRGGSLHPLNYALGLAQAAKIAGALIFANSRVQNIQEDKDGIDITTSKGRLRALKVLICTNGYSDPASGAIGRTIVPIRSIQVATEPLPDHVLNSIFPQGHAASDTRRLLLYFRKGPNNSFVMGGRGDYSQRGTQHQYDVLKKESLKLYPQLSGVKWTYHWGGYVAMTSNHYPQLLRSSDRIWAALGFNGRGVAMASSLGKVAADAVHGIDKGNLDFPVTSPKPIPFYFMRRYAVAAAIAWSRLCDKIGR